MNWRVRVGLLALLSRMPGGLTLYQVLQAGFGLHRRPDFLRTQLRWQAQLARTMVERGVELPGARIVEVGTGWVPIAPVGFWLCGADRVDTFDLNRWFLPGAFAEALRWLSAHRGELVNLWADLAPPAVLASRFDLLAGFVDDPHGFLERAEIGYHAPADASRTGLPDQSVDIHYSVQVLEHVSPAAIPQILGEAGRILRPGGWSIHQVDPSDHFSHFDRNISAIHFLRFTDRQWERVAGNRLAFHNRLRCCEHLRMFEESSLEVVTVESRLDERALAALLEGHPLATPFDGMDPHELARRSLFVGARKPDRVVAKDGPSDDRAAVMVPASG